MVFWIMRTPTPTSPPSPTPRRRTSVNLSVQPALLARARELNLNLSRVLEERIAELDAASRGDPFAEENAEAVAAYNARISRVGAFGDDVRAF